MACSLPLMLYIVLTPHFSDQLRSLSDSTMGIEFKAQTRVLWLPYILNVIFVQDRMCVSKSLYVFILACIQHHNLRFDSKGATNANR